MAIIKFYKTPGLLAGKLSNKIQAVKKITNIVDDIDTELCYYIESTTELNEDELKIVKWTLISSFDLKSLVDKSVYQTSADNIVIEIGPRLNFSTAFSSNAVSIYKSVGLSKITRVEFSIRYLIKAKSPLNLQDEESIVNVLHDRMTECRYKAPIETFDHGFVPENWFEVDVITQGRKALEDVNTKLGLAFDNWDLDFYTNLFKTKLKRNPTSVECFDLAQSNSEHSRHWFFRGKMIIDNVEQEKTLFDMIIDTQLSSNQNNVIKFADNSSAIKGFKNTEIIPEATYKPSPFAIKSIEKDLIFTAETHNFPTGVAPFSGATTGTGGRLRDIQGCGRGGYYIAGTAGYSVGNLQIPNYNQPWENNKFKYPTNMASPLDIIIEASNGASDYGNKFGEPLICGFTRSFGMIIDDKADRREWIKPIMFSGGLGTVDSNMTTKLTPEKGMEVVKIGGPVYRIGVGGGAASSVAVQGDNNIELDFGAVQRGDAEMEQKLNRLVRACTEMGNNNPILSIHDQGAGGNGNVLKEIVEPAGAVIFTKKFELGDPSISTMELWGAEYQENNAILCKNEDVKLLETIAIREKCPINFVGTVTGNGKIILTEDDDFNIEKYMNNNINDNEKRHPVDLDLEFILGKMPQKEFNMKRKILNLKKLSLPDNLTIDDALNRVLRLPSVSSKRYLTNKVDRCVTGLIVQQQCVGPLQIPLSDVAVVATSHFGNTGIATSIGEQPIKGLVNVKAGARMTVAEALSNIVFAKISDIRDIKCSGNWMWAAKLDGEGAALYEACQSMCLIMKEFGIAIDGGKDSLSMAARIDNDIVKAPGTLVVSCYAPVPDIKNIVTPDLKAPAMGTEGCLIYVDLSKGKCRLGGTALAQAFSQLGNNCPDVEDSQIIVNAFNATQKLIEQKLILAGHDISDGGLITCLLEMSFAGVCGINVDILHKTGSQFEILFSEEIGWVLEILPENIDIVRKTFEEYNIHDCIHVIGSSTNLGLNKKIIISIDNTIVVEKSVISLMKIWEETSYELEKIQTNIKCADEEFNGLENRKIPLQKLSFNPNEMPINQFTTMSPKIQVAVIREEGINGDREMAISLIQAGFDVWDITMQDLLNNKITLDNFRGVVFPGGFSYADVLGSAKGWAASLLFHPSICQQFDNFIKRDDTFSLGVCNGCQLMSHLGWIGGKSNDINEHQPNVILDHNKSERFECRWSNVKIEKSKSIMLQGMEGTVMGVWIAHGEGRFTFKNNNILNDLVSKGCVTIKYADDQGIPTETYPMNPNGSVDGIAGICSDDGRHLAMMPHPERCTQMWQWPYVPSEFDNFKVSPWLKIFQNAMTWCLANSKQ